MSRLPSGEYTIVMKSILKLHEGMPLSSVRDYIAVSFLNKTHDNIMNILNTQTHSGSTALMYIFKKPNKFSLFGKSYECPSFISTNGIMNEDLRNLVSTLLYNGADPAIRDNSGKTVFDYARLCGSEIEDELRTLVTTVKGNPGARNRGNAAYADALAAATARLPTFNPRGLRPPKAPQTPPPEPTMANILRAGQRGASRRKKYRKSKKSRKTMRR